MKTERDGFEPDPPRMQRESLAAIRHIEQVVPAAPLEGIVLRYGSFYGPGASESMVELVRKRRFPVVGDGAVDDRGPRFLQRQGQARARLAAEVGELA